MWKTPENLPSNVKPTDILEVENLVDDMLDQLVILRRGRRLMRRSYGGTSVLLQTMGRACYSLIATTEECLVLLYYMDQKGGEHGTETPKQQRSVCQKSFETSPDWIGDDGAGDSGDSIG